MQFQRTTTNISRIFAAITEWLKNNAWQQCLVPGCANDVVKPHSVQSALIRDYLAKNGQVYMFKPTAQLCQLSLVSYNKATSFTGFCVKHDSKLFRDVDFDNSRQFNPTSNRQIVLLSLRAVAREYWAKLNAEKLYQRIAELTGRQDYLTLAKMFNLTSADGEQFEHANEHCKEYLLGVKTSLKRLKQMFLSFYHQIEKARFHLTRQAVFHIPDSKSVAAASVFAPEFDLTGKQLNTFHLENDVTDVILNVFPANNGTWVVFAYHKRHSGTLLPFFNQIESLDQSGLKNVISKMIIMHCENVVLAPTFIDSLSEKSRNLMKEMYDNTIFLAKPYRNVPDMSLFENH